MRVCLASARASTATTRPPLKKKRRRSGSTRRRWIPRGRVVARLQGFEGWWAGTVISQSRNLASVRIMWDGAHTWSDVPHDSIMTYAEAVAQRVTIQVDRFAPYVDPNIAFAQTNEMAHMSLAFAQQQQQQQQQKIEMQMQIAAVQQLHQQQQQEKIQSRMDLEMVAYEQQHRQFQQQMQQQQEQLQQLHEKEVQSRMRVATAWAETRPGMQAAGGERGAGADQADFARAVAEQAAFAEEQANVRSDSVFGEQQPASRLRAAADGGVANANGGSNAHTTAAVVVASRANSGVCVANTIAASSAADASTQHASARGDLLSAPLPSMMPVAAALLANANVNPMKQLEPIMPVAAQPPAANARYVGDVPGADGLHAA